MRRIGTEAAARGATLLALLGVVCVYALSWHQRHESYRAWMTPPDAHVAGPVTALSTQDAYHWVRMARDLDAGRFQPGEPDRLRGLPDQEPYAERASLLAHAIRLAARAADGDYYRGSMLLPPLLAGLFVFPLFAYFHRLGFGASAVLGGLIGSFSVSYHSRSNHGYVDTDLLNLFLPMTVSALVLAIRRERSFRANLLLGVGAGATMYLFHWWYQQPGFFLAYLPFVALYLFAIRLTPWQIGSILAGFALASGPGYVGSSVASLRVFLEAYFAPPPAGQIVWPDILATIIEAGRQGPLENLQRVHGLLPVGLAGLAGLALLYATRLRGMIPITPLVLLGLWSLVGPRRFTMYLAPLVGVGVGVLLEWLVRGLGRPLHMGPLVRTALSLALCAALFGATLGHTAYRVVYHSVPPIQTVRALLEIKERVPPHAPMLTWWNYGYFLMDIGDFATYHDGALQGRLRTTLVARALFSTRQQDLVSLLAYLENHRFDALEAAIEEEDLSGEALLARVFDPSLELRGGNQFVLYLEDMLRIVGGMSYFGAWDFEAQSATPMVSRFLACLPMPIGNVFRCEGSQVDLDRGLLIDTENAYQLKAVLFVDDGTVVRQLDYPVEEGGYVQVLMRRGQIVRVQALEARLFHTNFNQQYLLGNYDRRLFEEVYNDFPVARVLRVRSRAEGDAGR